MLHFIRKAVLKDIVLEIKDIRSLEHLRNLYSDYLPWTGASIHPTAMMYLLNDIVLHRRKHIVECGSGISTLLIASMIKSNGIKARFCSIDHNADWLDILRSKLEANGTAEYVELIHAPLTETTEGWSSYTEWYDNDALEGCLGESPIDLLFIDGPPANDGKNPYSRYPALPFFFARLTDDATVILDDSCRKAEQAIARRWNAEFGLNLKQAILKGDIFLHTRGNRFNVL